MASEQKVASEHRDNIANIPAACQKDTAIPRRQCRPTCSVRHATDELWTMRSHSTLRALHAHANAGLHTNAIRSAQHPACGTAAAPVWRQLSHYMFSWQRSGHLQTTINCMIAESECRPDRVACLALVTLVAISSNSSSTQHARLSLVAHSSTHACIQMHQQHRQRP